MSRPNKKNVRRMDNDYMDHYDMKVERMKRRKKRFIRRFTIISAIIFLSFVFLLSYHMKQRTILSEAREQNEQLKAEMNALEIREKELLEEIELLKDEEYILDIARSNYFLSKKGEIIFQIDKGD